jgi:hypothetical protein
VAGFGFSDVETCSSATTVLVMSKMLRNCYLKETQSANKTSVNVTTQEVHDLSLFTQATTDS